MAFASGDEYSAVELRPDASGSLDLVGLGFGGVQSVINLCLPLAIRGGEHLASGEGIVDIDMLDVIPAE